MHLYTNNMPQFSPFCCRPRYVLVFCSPGRKEGSETLLAGSISLLASWFGHRRHGKRSPNPTGVRWWCVFIAHRVYCCCITSGNLFFCVVPNPNWDMAMNITIVFSIVIPTTYLLSECEWTWLWMFLTRCTKPKTLLNGYCSAHPSVDGHGKSTWMVSVDGYISACMNIFLAQIAFLCGLMFDIRFRLYTPLYASQQQWTASIS